MIKRILPLLALLFGLSAQADILVVVSASNPLRTITSEELSSLYLGRTQSFPTGEFALVFDHPKESSLREKFFRLTVGMTPSQINSYWSRLMFSGQTMPPRPLPNEETMIDVIRRNPGAIGYVSALPKESGLKILLHIRE